MQLIKFRTTFVLFRSPIVVTVYLLSAEFFRAGIWWFRIRWVVIVPIAHEDCIVNVSLDLVAQNIFDNHLNMNENSDVIVF